MTDSEALECAKKLRTHLDEKCENTLINSNAMDNINCPMPYLGDCDICHCSSRDLVKLIKRMGAANDNR